MYFSIATIAALSALVLRVSTQAVGTNCDITGTYTVVSGDTLNEIAVDNNVTVAQILFVNPTIINPNSIAIAQVISLPNPLCVIPEPKTAPAPTIPTATCVSNSKCTYVVVSGDTLTIIANDKLGITLASLVAANPQITNIDLIFVDQVLNVPVCESSKKEKHSSKKQTPKTVNKKEATPPTRRAFKA